MLAAIRALPATTGEAATARRTALRYLSQRRGQIRYAAFQEQGYPIGSGIVESAGKLVVGARLKGSGMHFPKTCGALYGCTYVPGTVVTALYTGRNPCVEGFATWMRRCFDWISRWNRQHPLPTWIESRRQ